MHLLAVIVSNTSVYTCMLVAVIASTYVPHYIWHKVECRGPRESTLYQIHTMIKVICVTETFCFLPLFSNSDVRYRHFQQPCTYMTLKISSLSLKSWRKCLLAQGLYMQGDMIWHKYDCVVDFHGTMTQEVILFSTLLHTYIVHTPSIWNTCNHCSTHTWTRGYF